MVIGSFISALIWNLSFLHITIVALELFFLFYFINRIGNKFIFLELLSFIAVTQLLFAPMLAEKFGVEMDVPFATYFEYAYPATLAYLLGLTIPLWKQKNLDNKTRVIFNELSAKYKNRYL